MSQTLYIPTHDRDLSVARVVKAIRALPPKKHKVEIKEVKGTRSQQQNKYLWGVVYPHILARGGEALAGWTSEDLHEYFLGSHFGWEELEGFGRKRLRPLRRSSVLNKTEFADYLESIIHTVAELGIAIPDPDPDLAA